MKASSWDSSPKTTVGGSPTGCGSGWSHCCRRGRSIRLVATIHACSIATRWMRSSSCCARATNGTLNATGICKSSSAHRRFIEWTEAGVFWEFWQRGLLAYDEVEGIDWSWLSMDGAITKAPLGGEKNRTESNRPSQAWYQAQRIDQGERHSDQRLRRRRQPQRLQDGA